MKPREQLRRELLDELASRFHDSANTLRSIARRIEDAGGATLAASRRLQEADRRLRADLDAGAEEVPFTYREYVEFASAAEFRRFARAAVITDADLEGLDWEQLSRRLLGNEQ